MTGLRTARPARASRPRSASISTRISTPGTTAPQDSSKVQAAAAVPPVADVVHDEHPGALCHRVLVDLNACRAVLERVVDTHRRAGQLAALAHRDEAQPRVHGDGCAEDESPRLRAGDGVDAPLPRLRVGAHDLGEELGIRDQRGDVLEGDTGLREVRDVAQLPRIRCSSEAALTPCPGGCAGSSWVGCAGHWTGRTCGPCVR